MDDLHKHKFQAHLIAFLLMVLAAIGMLFALPALPEGNGGIIWGLVGAFAAGNVLAALTK